MQQRVLRVERRDITRMRVDTIVNAASERMLGGGGVDGAIHAAAGPRLLEACRACPEVRPGVRCPTGEARITPGFDLPARYVVHTAGPIWRGGYSNGDELLASCYRASLALAEEWSLHSIAFPAISCGAFGFPLDRASAIAVREIRQYLDQTQLITTVVLVARDDSVVRVLRDAVSETA